MTALQSQFNLRKLLDPISPEDFIRKYWEKRSLYISGQSDKFRELFDRAAWEDACLQRAERGFDDQGIIGAFIDSRGEQVQFAVMPESATALSKIVTVCFSEIEKENAALAALVESFANEMGILDQVAVNCYASPDDQGYSIHYDAQDVFVLQIEGSKSWRFSSTPSVQSPCDYPVLTPEGEMISPTLGVVEQPDEASFEEAVLGPGDVLYVPSGAWHVARANKFSLALTISCVPSHMSKFLLTTLGGSLLKDPRWRARVPAAHVESRHRSTVPEETMHFFESQLALFQKTVAELDPSIFYRRWCAEMAKLEQAVALPVSSKRSNDAQIGTDDRLFVVRSPPFRYIVSKDDEREDCVYVFYGSRELACPIWSLPLMVNMADRSELCGRDACGWIGEQEWPSIQSVLLHLLDLGVLERDPECDRDGRVPEVAA